MSVERSEEDDDGVDAHSLLGSSRQVTAHLYSSIERSHQLMSPRVARHVSFALSSPGLTSSQMTVAPPLFTHRVGDWQKADHSLDLNSSRAAMRAMLDVAESVTDPHSPDMELHLQDCMNRSSSKLHIEEMEGVRTHIQSMLGTIPGADDGHEYQPPASQHFLDSNESDTTSQLLSAAVSLGGVGELFPRYSRLRLNPSAAASELQVLRESLESEHSRRKVCEQEVASLHSKALQFQQQLTLAVAADRKKDTMIQQLDKTLAKVVESWKKQDQDRTEEASRLREEKEETEKAISKQREIISRLEHKLSQVEETLTKEQKINHDLHTSNRRLELEASELHACVEELRRETDGEIERQKIIQTESNNSITQLQHKVQELQQQLTQTSQQLEREKDQLKQEVLSRAEAESRGQQHQEELEQIRRERDTLRVDRALDQTQFEAQKTQMEVEFRLLTEKKLSERLSAIQEENATHNGQLRQQHRKQLLDLSARHEQELTAQLDQFTSQLHDRDNKLQQLTQYYQHKLSALQAELVTLSGSKKKVETEKEELVSRLQGMMQSHWAETFRLLTNQDQAVTSTSTNAQASEPSSVPPLWETFKKAPLPETSRSATGTDVSQGPDVSLEKHRGKKEVMSHYEYDVLNTSKSDSFSPLEPVLDHSLLSDRSDCNRFWIRPVTSEQREIEERNEKTREAQIQQNQQNDRLNPNHNQCEHNHISIKPMQRCTNHGSSSDYMVSGKRTQRLYSQYSEKPPSIRNEALPIRTALSSGNEGRQMELQYYVSKLLERSPGDPLEQPIKEQSGAEPTEERILQNINDLLQAHASQQLQGVLQSFRRSDDGQEGLDSVRLIPDQKLYQHEKHEESLSSQQAVSRPIQNRKAVGRRKGSQRVWK